MQTEAGKRPCGGRSYVRSGRYEPAKRVSIPPPAAKSSTFGSLLAAVEEAVEHPHAEPEGVYRHPLVHAVEHPEEVDVGGQPQGREAEAPDAQPAERLRVGPAGHAVGDRLGLR